MVKQKHHSSHLKGNKRTVYSEAISSDHSPGTQIEVTQLYVPMWKQFHSFTEQRKSKSRQIQLDDICSFGVGRSQQSAKLVNFKRFLSISHRMLVLTQRQVRYGYWEEGSLKLAQDKVISLHRSTLSLHGIADLIGLLRHSLLSGVVIHNSLVYKASHFGQEQCHMLLIKYRKFPHNQEAHSQDLMQMRLNSGQDSIFRGEQLVKAIKKQNPGSYQSILSGSSHELFFILSVPDITCELS